MAHNATDCNYRAFKGAVKLRVNRHQQTAEAINLDRLGSFVCIIIALAVANALNFLLYNLKIQGVAEHKSYK